MDNSTPENHATLGRQPAPIIFLILAFIVVGGGLTIVTFPDLAALNLTGNDDYMRLQQVRDWLAGQPWADVDQRRLVTKEGGAMHFSRIPDVPMAAIILATRPFLGERGAELAMLTAYPLILLFGFFWISTHTASFIGGRRAGFAAVLLIPITPDALWQFAPGRIDHHNVQILLLISAVYCMVRSIDRPKWGLGAAAASILMMAIGMETLPFVAAIALGIGLIWLMTGRKQTLIYYGAGLAALAFPVLLAGHAGGNPFAIYCDAYAAPYATASTLIGLGAIALGMASPQLPGIVHRLVAAAIIGAIAVAGSIWAYPQCAVAGPYSLLDQEAREAWFLYGQAVRSAPVVMAQDGVLNVLPVYIIPIIALTVSSFIVFQRREDDRLRALVVTIPLAIAAVLTLWQLRIAPFAHALSIIPLAIMLGQIRDHINAFALKPVLTAALLALFITPLPYTAVSLLAVLDDLENVELASETDDPSNMAQLCLRPDHILALNALPQGVFMNQFDMGPRIIGLTHHSITAGFYHRNLNTMIDSIQFFDGPFADAHCKLSSAPVDYVIHCPITRKTGNSVAGAATLGERIKNQSTPEWLEEIMIEGLGPLRVFKPNVSNEDAARCEPT